MRLVDTQITYWQLLVNTWCKTCFGGVEGSCSGPKSVSLYIMFFIDKFIKGCFASGFLGFCLNIIINLSWGIT